MINSSTTPGRWLPLLPSIAVAVLLALVAAPVAAVDGGPATATLRVATDGFRYLDGSRDSVLDTTGWCAGGDDRLTTLACDIDDVEKVSGSAALHTGLLGFGALRRVSSQSGEDASRLLVIDVFPDRPGVLRVVVDAAPAGGATFGLLADSAFPAPEQASAQRVEWAAVSDGSGQLTFGVAYDSDLGESGAADAIPATTITLDFGEGQVAAEHLRGGIPAPTGLTVARTSELAYQARVVPSVAAPRLDGGQPVAALGQAGTVRFSARNQVTALGHAPPLSFETDSVTSEYFQPGPRARHGVLSWRSNQSADSSVFNSLEVQNSPFGEQPTWLRIKAGMHVRGDAGRGLVDGEAVRATYHVDASTELRYRPADDEVPRNNDGRLVFDWDGRIFDEVGFIDSYGSLARRYGPRWASVPPYHKVGVVDNDAYDWLQSMWTAHMRVEGGDIDRRDADSTVLQVEGITVSKDREPDVSMPLDVPDEGWQIWRLVALGSTGSGDPQVDDLSEWNEDGSMTLRRRVSDGSFWLESQLAPDGTHTWAWPLTIITDAWRWDSNAVRPPTPPTAIDTHVVPDGEQLEVQVFTRDGGHDRLVLGPGTHQVRITPQGTLELLERHASAG